MRDLQNKVKEFAKNHNLEHSKEIAALDLLSEFGEVAKEILKATDYGKKEFENREELKSEMGDLFYSLISLANSCGVDLEEALEAVLTKYESRLKSSGQAGSRR